MGTILSYYEIFQAQKTENKEHIIIEKVDNPCMPSNISLLCISSPYPEFDVPYSLPVFMLFL